MTHVVTKEVAVEDPTRSGGASRSPGWLHPLIVCGLVLFGVLVLSLGGSGWETVLIIAVLITCPLVMLAMLGASRGHH